MRHLLLLSAVSLTAFAAAAEAETVVMTATRTPENIEVTGTSLSLVTGKELETRQSLVMSDVLSELPGISVVRNGGVGQSTALYIRGADAGQSLVLIDGIRLNDPSGTSGQALLGDILANGLSRVEVLRGPQSTLYGSDAIGGVVNMITARGGDNTLKLSAEAGSLDTVHVNAAASGTVSIVEFGAAANYYTTSGVSAADARDGNKEPDGYTHFGATGNLRVKASDAVSLDARVYYTRARDSFDGYPPPAYSFADTHQYGDNEMLALYGGINADLMGGRLTNRLSVAYTGSDRTTTDTVEDFWAKGSATRIEYQGGFKLDSANELTFGFEDERTGLGTQSQYDVSATRGGDRIDGLYAQWQSVVLPGVTLTGGLRYDHDRKFGDHTSYKLNAAWQVTGTTTLRANLGDGFKAPSLYQLYSQYSNPVATLKPEQATGWEVGADQKLGDWSASLTYFQRHTANQIDFFSCWGVTSAACNLRLISGGYYYNVNRSLARGVEAAISGNITSELKLDLAYTNLTDFDQASRLQLARRPHDTASGTLSWIDPSGITFGATVTYLGSRFDDAYHLNALKDRAELKLFGSYALQDGMEVFGRIENLTDNRNETVGGYGTVGRSFFAGIRAKI